MYIVAFCRYDLQHGHVHVQECLAVECTNSSVCSAYSQQTRAVNNSHLPGPRARIPRRTASWLASAEPVRPKVELQNQVHDHTCGQVREAHQSVPHASDAMFGKVVKSSAFRHHGA